MRSAAVGFLLGMVALLSLPALPEVDTGRLLGLLTAAGLALVRPPTRPLAFCLLGFLTMYLFWDDGTSYALVGLAYAFVGPDLELSAGLDSFDSVATSGRSRRRGGGRPTSRSCR